jgi:hypothetical protein
LPEASFSGVFQVHQGEEVDALAQLENIVKLAILLERDELQGGVNGRLVENLEVLAIFEGHAVWKSQFDPGKRHRGGAKILFNGQGIVGGLLGLCG